MFKQLSQSVSEFLNSPGRVLTACAGIGIMMLVLDGTLLKLWNLKRDAQRIEENISKIQASSRNLDIQIRKAREIDFVERQARDRFDLVGENDLVFVFTNESD